MSFSRYLSKLAALINSDGTVPTAAIQDSAITTAKIATGAVATVDLADGAVTTIKIADANVTTAKIADANVTTAKIADANVTNAKIANSAVTYAKIQNVTAGRLLGRDTSGAGVVQELPIQVDANGNVAAGGAPSAWGTLRGFQVGLANFSGVVGSQGAWISSNAFYNGSSWIYQSSSQATFYNQQNGAHTWQIAPSGTAGNPITFTQAMTLDASNNLSLASGNIYTAVNSGVFFTGSVGSFGTGVYGTSTNHLALAAGGSERARIDPSGNFLFNSGYGSVATAYGCRAWVNFNGTGTVAINASGNVSSITDNGVGDYTVNFSTAISDTNYATLVSHSRDAGGNPPTPVSTQNISGTSTKTTSAVRVGAGGNAGAYDPTQVSAAIFR